MPLLQKRHAWFQEDEDDAGAGDDRPRAARHRLRVQTEPGRTTSPRSPMASPSGSFPSLPTPSRWASMASPHQLMSAMATPRQSVHQAWRWRRVIALGAGVCAAAALYGPQMLDHARQIDINKDGWISREEAAAAMGLIFLGVLLLKAAVVICGFVYFIMQVWRRVDRARQLNEMSPFRLKKRSMSLDESMLEYLQTHYDSSAARRSGDGVSHSTSGVSMSRMLTGRSDLSGTMSSASTRRMTWTRQDIEASLSNLVELRVLQDVDTQNLQDLCRGMARWEFDMFEVDALTHRALPFVGFVCLDVYSGLIDIDKVKLVEFLSDVEGSYRNVAYHNSLHGASVARSVYSFCAGCGLAFSEENMEFMLILAGLVHDVHHPGLTASFLTKAATLPSWPETLDAPLEPADLELALKYNDQSPLEHMHCAIAFDLLRRPKNAFLSPEDVAALRRPLIKCILGTDMVKHAETMTRMSGLLDNLRHGDSVGSLPWYWPAKPPPGSNQDQRVAWEQTLQQEFVMEIFLHAADIGNPALPFEQWVKWNRRVQDEFHAQGDRERDFFGLVFSPLAGFDRNTGAYQEHVFTKGFMQYLALPFFEQLDELTQVSGHVASAVNISVCLSTLRKNLELWDQRCPSKEKEEGDADGGES
eukprot:TRINITY_DN3464_c0_g1_i2.p1 TRINITY_DN3464_c0_g1~~TRINITY_DN3464_c0_g1_i2.p1  ORF type:complete len:644 (+),score=152.68 TRINITY_DN3464_c0_g1_i2:1-1932(+)